MGASERFDAVLLDAGGVLLLPDPAVLGPLVAYYGGSAELEVHRRAHHRAMAVRSAAGGTEHDWSDYETAYVEATGVPPADLPEAVDAFARTRNPFLWRFPIASSVTALERLAVAGVQLGVVSNASGQIAELLRRSGVCQVGDGPGIPVRTVIDSHDVGFEKPDPRIFDVALAHYPEADPGRVAYVGDSVTIDVAGARAAGLHPILMDPYDDHPNVDCERIRELGDLLHR